MSLLISTLLAAAGAAGTQTDFGIRTVPATMNAVEPGEPSQETSPSKQMRFDQASVVQLAGRWGRVTSTLRSPERNRAVGGAPNSHHLRGRAIDIARRAGVRHSDIERAYRQAGYHLIESLDEGDHSHFAFGSGITPARRVASVVKSNDPFKGWRVVYAPKT